MEDVGGFFARHMENVKVLARKNGAAGGGRLGVVAKLVDAVDEVMIPISATHGQAALPRLGGGVRVSIADDVLESKDADPIGGASPWILLEVVRVVEVVPRAPKLDGKGVRGNIDTEGQERCRRNASHFSRRSTSGKQATGEEGVGGGREEGLRTWHRL